MHKDRCGLYTLHQTLCQLLWNLPKRLQTVVRVCQTVLEIIIEICIRILRSTVTWLAGLDGVVIGNRKKIYEEPLNDCF